LADLRAGAYDQLMDESDDRAEVNDDADADGAGPFRSLAQLGRQVAGPRNTSEKRVGAGVDSGVDFARFLGEVSANSSSVVLLMLEATQRDR